MQGNHTNTDQQNNNEDLNLSPLFENGANETQTSQVDEGEQIKNQQTIGTDSNGSDEQEEEQNNQVNEQDEKISPHSDDEQTIKEVEAINKSPEGLETTGGNSSNEEDQDTYSQEPEPQQTSENELSKTRTEQDQNAHNHPPASQEQETVNYEVKENDREPDESNNDQYNDTHELVATNRQEESNEFEDDEDTQTYDYHTVNSEQKSNKTTSESRINGENIDSHQMENKSQVTRTPGSDTINAGDTRQPPTDDNGDTMPQHQQTTQEPLPVTQQWQYFNDSINQALNIINQSQTDQAHTSTQTQSHDEVDDQSDVENFEFIDNSEADENGGERVELNIAAKQFGKDASNKVKFKEAQLNNTTYVQLLGDYVSSLIKKPDYQTYLNLIQTARNLEGPADRNLTRSACKLGINAFRYHQHKVLRERGHDGQSSLFQKPGYLKASRIWVNDKCGRLFYPNSYGKRYAPNADLEGSFFSASNAIYSQLANEVKSGSERKLQVVNELLGDHNASVEAIYQGRSDFPELINKQYNSASRLENGGQRFLRALTQLAIIGTAMAIGAAPGLVAGLAAGAFTGPVGALSAFSVATAACGTALGLYFGKQFAEWATNTFPFRHSMEDQIKDFEQRAEMYVHQTPRP